MSLPRGQGPHPFGLPLGPPCLEQHLTPRKFSRTICQTAEHDGMDLGNKQTMRNTCLCCRISKMEPRLCLLMLFWFCCVLYASWGQGIFVCSTSTLWCPQHLKQCLSRSRCLRNICWVNRFRWMCSARVKSKEFEVRAESWLCHLLAIWPGRCLWTSVSPMLTLRSVIVSTSRCPED